MLASITSPKPAGLDRLRNMDWNSPASVVAAVGGGGGGHLPMPKTVHPKKVRSEALERSTAIFTHWNILRAILDRHEETIHKRWLKKTKTQRVEMLLRAWPNMVSCCHRLSSLAASYFCRVHSSRHRNSMTELQ